MRHLPPFIKAFRDWWRASFCRIHCNLLTRRLIGCLRTGLRSSRPCYLHLWDSWYLRYADEKWVYGWHSHSRTLLPLSLGVGRVIVRPGMPPLNFYVSGQWTVYQQNSPVTSKWSVNFGVMIAFPQFRKGQ